MLQTTLKNNLISYIFLGCAIGKVVSQWLPTMAVEAQSQVRSGQVRSGHVRSMVGKVALAQFLTEYFGFPCEFSLHQHLHIHQQSYHRHNIALIPTLLLCNSVLYVKNPFCPNCLSTEIYKQDTYTDHILSPPKEPRFKLFLS
jgi:hypothetical protein